MNKPEWLSILIGCIMSSFGGACQIILALLLAKTIDVRAILCLNFYHQKRNFSLVIIRLYKQSTI